MGKMPLYTMLQKARSAGGWTMVAQLEGDAAGSQLLLLEGRPVWQRGDSTVLLQHLTELQGSWYPLCCRYRHLCGALWRGAAAGSLRRWTCGCSRCAACKAAGPDGPCNG